MREVEILMRCTSTWLSVVVALAFTLSSRAEVSEVDVIRVMGVNNVMSNWHNLAFAGQLMGLDPEKRDKVRETAVLVEKTMTRCRDTFRQYAQERGIAQEKMPTTLLSGYDVLIHQATAMRVYLDDPSEANLKAYADAVDAAWDVIDLKFFGTPREQHDKEGPLSRTLLQREAK